MEIIFAGIPVKPLPTSQRSPKALISLTQSPSPSHLLIPYPYPSSQSPRKAVTQQTGSGRIYPLGIRTKRTASRSKIEGVVLVWDTGFGVIVLMGWGTERLGRRLGGVGGGRDGMDWWARGSKRGGGGGEGKVGGDWWRGRRRERRRDGAKTGVIRCVWQGLAASIARSLIAGSNTLSCNPFSRRDSPSSLSSPCSA